MSFRWAACAAATLFACAPCIAQPADTLTLSEAFRRVEDRHPDLARYRHVREAAQGALEEAQQRPVVSADAEVENALGTGAAHGFDQTEVTLSLASVLERGSKRSAREQVAAAQLRSIDVEQEARHLDLLAEAARRYHDVLAGQAFVQIAEAELKHRELTVQASAQRVRAGASPDAVRLAAEAAAARSRLQLSRVLADAAAARTRLATLWSDLSPDFERVTGDATALPAIAPIDSLFKLIEESPELRRFADEARLREARVQLARSDLATDVEWRAGIRRLEQTDDWAMVAGISVPLGTRRRAAPRIRSAEAELAALSLEKESQQLTLHSTLIEAYARISTAIAEVQMARSDLLPKLLQAAAAAGGAYRAGALSYLEWAQLQDEVTAARREQVQTALHGHRALIEVQRLTAQPFILSGSDREPRSRP